MPKLENYSISFQGRRKNNEDSCLSLSLGENAYFFAVADGMGGAIGGEIASKLVIEASKEYLQKQFMTKVYPEDMKEMLQRVFELSQQSISNELNKKPALQGMGSTLTCVLIQDNKYVIGNLGDSRVYLLKDNALHLMTEDHTYIQQAQKELGGKLDPGIASRYSNYLVRSIDGGEDKPDLFPLGKPFELLSEGEAFLLCSDGLITDKVTNDYEIFRDYILGTKSLKIAAEQLISFAYNEGSKDNITVVLAQYGKLERDKKSVANRDFPPNEGPEQGNNKGKKENRNGPKNNLKSLVYITLISSILIISGFIVYKDYFRNNHKKVTAENSNNKEVVKPTEADQVEKKKKDLENTDTITSETVKPKREQSVKEKAGKKMQTGSKKLVKEVLNKSVHKDSLTAEEQKIEIKPNQIEKGSKTDTNNTYSSKPGSNKQDTNKTSGIKEQLNKDTSDSKK